MSASPENSVLLSYQREWIADQSQVKIGEKSRRIGLTWAEAADDVLIAATAGIAGSDIFYIGYNQDIAREYIETAAGWSRKLEKAADAIEETVFKDADKDILTYRIRFASGHKILALSSRPSNLRGHQGVAVIDEAAFHPELGELLKAAMAFLMWGGKVRVISTHDGADNAFNELIIETRAGRLPYSLHRVDFDQALTQGLFKAICRSRDAKWSPDAEASYRAGMLAFYRENADEELFCIPRSSGGAYLPSALVESRMSAGVPILRWHIKESFLDSTEYQRGKACEDWIAEHLAPAVSRMDDKLMTCFGEDFGRSGDLTVIWPMQLGAAMLRRTPFVIELRNIAFRQQEQILKWLIARMPRFIGGAMDAGGNGQYLAEQMQAAYGDRVEAVMLSVDWYRNNIPRYKAAFEDGTLDIPKDADILADHRMIRMERGVPRIPDRRERDAQGNPRHGDSAIAGALAFYASTMPSVEYSYTPARAWPGARRDRPEDDMADDAPPRSFFAQRLAKFRKGAY